MYSYEKKSTGKSIKLHAIIITKPTACEILGKVFGTLEDNFENI